MIYLVTNTDYSNPNCHSGYTFVGIMSEKDINKTFKICPLLRLSQELDKAIDYNNTITIKRIN